MADGRDRAARVALELFRLVGNADGVRGAGDVLRRHQRLSVIVFGGAAVALTLAISPGWLPGSPLPAWLRVAAASIAGAIAALTSVSTQDGVVNLRRLGIPFMFAGAAAGLFMQWLTSSTPGAATVAFFVAFFGHVVISSPRSKPPIDVDPPQPLGAFRHVLARNLERVERVIRSLRDQMKR
jgi:hypothetical protein